MLFIVFLLTAFLGSELIGRVPSQLHTPLMSGANAISGIVLVGAIASLNTSDPLAFTLGAIATIAATINVVGGYLVTDRMLAMFSDKSDKTAS